MQRPASVMVFGVLNIVFAVLGVIGMIFSLLLFLPHPDVNNCMKPDTANTFAA